MPWLDGEEVTEQFNYDTSNLWVDPAGPMQLSAKQMKKFVAWLRPEQVFQERLKSGSPALTGAAEPDMTMIQSISPYSIKQDTISDCSFVASLCIAAAYERKTKKQLITSIIFPQDASGRPVYNPSGKYLVKLWVNGVPRKVTVDDLLPAGRNGKLLCSTSSNPRELWVSIVEKAYLSVCGMGYDFGGSTSSVDLYTLTGWLPEQIFFEENKIERGQAEKRAAAPLDDYQPSERVWERLVSAHQYGDCLITMATSGGSSLSEEEADRLGLVTMHAYAVLDVREVGGERVCQLKNPWARRRWKGPYSVEDSARWTDQMKLALGYDHEADLIRDNGVFWIDWESCKKYFPNVFLNWNPKLFRHRSILHALWPVGQGPRHDTFSLGLNPQYTLVVPYPSSTNSPAGPPTVWVLLTRHQTDLDTDLATDDHLTMHVYSDCLGQRVYYPENPMYIGAYPRRASGRGLYNPHTLVRFDLPEEGLAESERRYTLVLSQFEKSRDVRYTLQVHCTSNLTLSHTPWPPTHRQVVTSEWVASNAGGGLGLGTFRLNPQYQILLEEAMQVHLQLEAPKELKINLQLMHSSGKGVRIDAAEMSEAVSSSGSYRNGFCYLAEANLAPGLYSVIPSTYKAHQLGAFILTLCSSGPVLPPQLVPPEGYEMHHQVVKGAWEQANGTAAGSPKHGRYVDNPAYLIAPLRRTTVLFRICLPEGAPRGPAINVALFPLRDDGSLGAKARPSEKHAMITSHKGVYSGLCGGAVTPKILLEPSKRYVAIASSFDPEPSPFELHIFSSPGLPPVESVQLPRPQLS
ncbi:unnamed protein product [Chrysoparadoxa australica]